MLLTNNIQIYCDGSGYRENIGAAAVLFRSRSHPRTLRLHLGKDKEHTVFKAEEVRLMLAAKLLEMEEDLMFPISISIDNQAALTAGENSQARPGSYIAEYFNRQMKNIARRHPNFDVTLRWSPGHKGIHSNEMADKEAKLAATSRENNSNRGALPQYLGHGVFPLSLSALKQAHCQETKHRWKRMWATSPRYNRIQRLDPKVINRSFVKLTATFPKHLTGLLMSLRSQHAPLNQHHHIKKTDSPFCPHCPEREETVHHYPLECPQYQRERHTIQGAIGHDASSIPYLLTSPDASLT